MEHQYIDDFDLERIVKAVEEDLHIKPIERPEVVVKNYSKDEPTGHVVNLDRMECTCKDYEYNCKPTAKEIGDNKACKHLYRVVLEKHDML
jgi:hypothetical protein